MGSCKALQGEAVLARTPFIFLTAKGEKNDLRMRHEFWATMTT